MKTFIAALLLSVFFLPVFGQNATPSAEQMIEQLKKPRTRSLGGDAKTRNLEVQATGVTSPAAGQPTPVAVATPEAARPSLSLQIQFDFNSARVRPESQQALITLAQALKSDALAGSKFAVEGHTDAKGGIEFNRKLSQMRADAVRSFLGTKGVGADRLLTFGKGSSELANPADPFAAENRRVRIVNQD